MGIDSNGGKTAARFVFVFLSVLTCFGCGHVGITGKVVFDDGTPLETGQIRMIGPDGLARAKIESDGSFRVVSVSGRKGVPRGVYKVAIEGAAIPGEPVGPDADPLHGPFTPATPLIAAKYNDPETSGIELDTKRQRHLVISVERP